MLRQPIFSELDSSDSFEVYSEHLYMIDSLTYLDFLNADDLDVLDECIEKSYDLLNDNEIDSLLNLEKITSENPYYINFYNLLAKNPESLLTRCCLVRFACTKMERNGSGLVSISLGYNVNSMLYSLNNYGVTLPSSLEFYQNKKLWDGFLALIRNAESNGTLSLDWNFISSFEDTDKLEKILFDVIKNVDIKKIELHFGNSIMRANQISLDEKSMNKLITLSNVLKKSDVEVIKLFDTVLVSQMDVFLKELVRDNNKLMTIGINFDSDGGVLPILFFETCCPAILPSHFIHLNLQDSRCFYISRNQVSSINELNKIATLNISSEVARKCDAQLNRNFWNYLGLSNLFDLDCLEVNFQRQDDISFNTKNPIELLDYFGDFLAASNLKSLRLNLANISDNYNHLGGILKKINDELKKSNAAHLVLVINYPDKKARMSYVDDVKSVPNILLLKDARQLLFSLFSGDKNIKDLELEYFDFYAIDGSTIKKSFWQDFFTHLEKSHVERINFSINNEGSLKYNSDNYHKAEKIVIRNALKTAGLASLKHLAAVTIFNRGLHKDPSVMDKLPQDVKEYVGNLRIGVHFSGK